MDISLKPNVSTNDSVIRMVLGSTLILGVLFLFFSPWITLISIYFIHTAIIRYDPLYALTVKLRESLHLGGKPHAVVFHKKTAAR